MPPAAPTPTEIRTPTPDQVVEPDLPWIVLVWNDPINLMEYVTFVFQKLFGYDLAKATELMLDVHEKGRAVVSSGSKEKAELDVFRADLRARDIYLMSAALAYFYLSNRFTLSAFLGEDLGAPAELAHWEQFITAAVIRQVSIVADPAAPGSS